MPLPPAMNESADSDETIFAAALQWETPAQRAAYLDEACAGDADRRRRVEDLLRASDDAGTFLDRPVGQPKPPGAAPEPLATIRIVLADDPTEAPGAKIGRYKLLQQIGEGGCGTVFMAEQEEPVRRRVALKVIKLGMDTKSVVARFEAERQALAMMDHPNIAKVLDAGATDSGRPYFVMELVRGIPITRYCDENKLDTQARLDLFIKVCQAIQHAHQKGIIHRDIKPSNILVTLHDGVPVPKVIDFGIAKATEGRLTNATLFTAFEQFIGTPAYMSPEQAEMSGLDIDTRSDIYSLGVLLYELLTGKTPFDAKELAQSGLDAMRRTIREKEPQRPSTRLSTMQGEALTITASAHGTDSVKLLKRIRGDLDWIVMKCLEKDRTRRYETANGLAADLRRHQENEPVVARPPSAAYKFQKAIRRNKMVFSAGAIVAVALLLAVGLSTWQAIVASQARQQESRANDRLRVQVQETDQARRAAEKAALAETQQRFRAEELLQSMQLQKAEDLLGSGSSVPGLTLLGQMLRKNPSNEVAASRFASAMLVAPRQPLTEPLRHEQEVYSAEFSPDGLRVVTACIDKTARVWDARTGQPLIEPLRHEGPVLSAQFSPDGQRVVTASGDKTARVWDARTGQPLTEPLRHGGGVVSALFSPDGLGVVTASWDRTARVWDAHTGQPLTQPLQHGKDVVSAEFSSDGLRVVTASYDKTARVWNARTGRPLTEPLRHDLDLFSARFSPDGLRVVTASADKTARVWDALTGQPITEPLRHEVHVASARFSPDGLRVVTASHDRTARVWDARTGQPLTEPLRHGSAVLSAQFSPDGLRVVTASHDRTARVWDAHTGQVLTEPLRHEQEVTSAEFSPDGQRVVTASYDKTARVWSARIVQPVTEPLRHEGGVNSALFSQDGLRIVTASWDNTARLWDAHTGQPITEPLRHEQEVYSAEFSPDGLRVVTACIDKTARVWDARTGRPLIEPLRHEQGVYSAEFSPDGHRVVTGSGDKTARVWDARTGQPITEPLRHMEYVSSAEFSPDGLRVVTASGDMTARVWNARTGQPLTEPLRHGDQVLFAQFSPDGHRVVTGSRDRTARVWDAGTGRPFAEPLRHEQDITSARFSPDGLRVVTASGDKTARVWDVRTGQPLTEPLRHEGPVLSAQFSPDGLQVVTASEDKTARVWDARTGHPLTEPLRHEHTVQSAQFSPDGLRVVTASHDGTARVWEVVAPPAPVPAWFLDWAEARIGRRFDPMSLAGAVPITEQRRQQESVAARTGTDSYTRIAQWVQADPAKRALSPHATLMVPEYVRRRIDENTLPSLREAVRMSPTNSLALARLALAELAQDVKQQPGRLVEAELIARQAIRLDPLNGESWRALGAVELAKGQTVEAMVAVERALQFDPANREAWELKGRLLIRDHRPAEAQQAYRSALASISTDPVAGFQVRVGLLEKHLGVLEQLGHPKPPEPAEREIMRWLVEEIVTRSRRLSGPGIPGLLEPLEGLAKSCREAGFDGEGDYLLKGCEGELRRFAATHPGDLLLSLRFAALDAWFGREKELAATSSRILEFARNTKDAITAERAAKICSLHPSDERTQEVALGLARRAVELGMAHGFLPYFQMALGMAEYRSGHWVLAEQAFAAAGEMGKGNPHVEGPAAFYTAMSLFRQGKPELARQLAASAAAKMKPLPKDEQNPLAGDTSADDLIVWLAHKEAMALLDGIEITNPGRKATP
jgi:eukaryotic-like serine/threonine-protein kinase